jgi:hypothetical protein
VGGRAGTGDGRKKENKEERKKKEERKQFYRGPDAKIHGVIHGAKIHDAMHPCQVTTSAPRRQCLGASDPGAMPLYLSADDYSAKIRVHFLKSFRKGHI